MDFRSGLISYTLASSLRISISFVKSSDRKRFCSRLIILGKVKLTFITGSPFSRVITTKRWYYFAAAARLETSFTCVLLMRSPKKASSVISSSSSSK